MMNVTNTENVISSAMGLEPLNQASFKQMAQCGHRIVSIKMETPSKFKIGTECTSGVKDFRHSVCEGYMQFMIKPTGVNLYIGVFPHHDKCPKHTDIIPVTEDIDANDGNFKTSWQKPIESAKQYAQRQVEQEELGAESNSGDVVGPSRKTISANNIHDDITKLEAQFQKYFSA